MTPARALTAVALVAALALGGAAPADPAALTPRADERITIAELGELLRRGPVRVELELDRDGRVVEVEVDDDTRDEDELEGRIVALDAAALTLDVEHLGRVHFGDARRFELRGDRRVDRAAWVAAVEAALAAGERVGVEADGTFRADGFSATQLELEGTFEVEVKATVSARDLDVANATLRLGGVSYDLGRAVIKRDR